jgi:NNP family nitrate/nitrite transporter-like MFS transporter
LSALSPFRSQRARGAGKSALDYWEPEDRLFWAREGAQVARRNLLLSIPALVLSFAVWMVWSVVVVQLPRVGFHFSANQLFWLAALPGLAGGTLRLFFSFMVPVFGGRTWTALSTAALLVPAIGLGLAVQDPATGYPTFLALALLAGIGGGNFASSMANISFFYPIEQKGAALGWNAGLGNLGVGLAQFAVPLAIGVGLFGAVGGAAQAWGDGTATREIWLQNAGYVWVPLIVLCALAAWFGMDDLAPVKASFEDQAVIFMRKHNWILSWLYLGTFGSFIGFAAGFPLLAEMEFAGLDATTYAFVGPLLGALARPAGGWLADRIGGARVALACFGVMAFVIAALLLAHGDDGHLGYPAFLVLFTLLFIASGAGNGAVFQMIPAVFVADRRRAFAGQADASARAVSEGTLESAASLGFASAIAAFGGFFIPKAYGTAVALTGGTAAALYPFFAFYVSCAVVTWWFYARNGAESPC